jgi:hypothetical protein
MNNRRAQESDSELSEDEVSIKIVCV